MKTMINNKKGVMIIVLLTMLAPTTMMAQDKVEASVGADLVSGYIWRGQDLGNISVQPSVGITYKGFSLGAWGSVGFDKEEAKEVDFTLGYSVCGFSVSVTDYFFNKGINFKSGEELAGRYFQYGSASTAHVFEMQIGYDFGPLAVNWYTNFAGNDGLNKDGDRAYSSYISLGAPFKVGGLDWRAEVGAVPWSTSFYNGFTNGFAVSDISLMAKKEIKITESFMMPIFAKLSMNPCTEDTYFTFGLTF